MLPDETTTHQPTPAPLAGVILAGVLVLAALVVGAWFVWAVLSLDPCGGDGGSPYAAPASPRGRFCDSGGPELSLGAGPALLVLGVVLAGLRARWLPLVVAAIAGVALTFSPLVIASALSARCADEPDSMTGPQLSRYQASRCGHY